MRALPCLLLTAACASPWDDLPADALPPPTPARAADCLQWPTGPVHVGTVWPEGPVDGREITSVVPLHNTCEVAASGNMQVELLGYGPFELVGPERLTRVPTPGLGVSLRFRGDDRLVNNGWLRLVVDDRIREVRLTGTRAIAGVHFDPDRPALGRTTAGCSRSETLTVYNTGTLPLRLDALEARPDDGALQVTPDGDNRELLPNQQRTLDLTFRPRGRDLVDRSVRVHVSVLLDGTGVDYPTPADLLVPVHAEGLPAELQTVVDWSEAGRSGRALLPAPPPVDGAFSAWLDDAPHEHVTYDPERRAFVFEEAPPGLRKVSVRYTPGCDEA